MNTPEIFIIFIHCSVKVHACISNKYSRTKLNGCCSVLQWVLNAQLDLCFSIVVIISKSVVQIIVFKWIFKPGELCICL